MKDDREWVYPISFSAWGDEERAAIERVIASDEYTMGPECAAMEREFAEFHKMKHAIMVNSGSSANLVAVAALFNKKENPLRRGQRVIVPAIAWSTTYAPLVQYGLDLVVVDVDDTWNSPAHWNHQVMDGVGLVVGCSILGNPAYLREWRRLAHRHNAYFIEDNCESIAALVGSRDHPGTFNYTGTFGCLNTFSFFHSHQISAIEGGMITTNDDELADLCRMLRAHGWHKDVVKPVEFEDEYDFRVHGYSVRPLEIHAAIAREQLKKVETARAFRQSNLNNFEVMATNLPITLQKPNGVVSPFGIQLRVRDRDTRSRLVRAFRAAGVNCRLPTAGSFLRHAYGKKWSDQITPNADHIHDCGLFLGNAPFDIRDKMQVAIDVMWDVLV
jgi:CDP-6-deoxy-D-xylo-4-hexulose-3-dehydrase